MGTALSDQRTIVILQPGYLPWLGFFEQMYQSDVFVFYDDVQFDKNGWRNRNRIKTSQGWQWLSVPMHLSGQNQPLINEALIDNRQTWQRKHLTALKINYSKAPYFDRYFGDFEEIYNQEWDRILNLDVALIQCLMKQLALNRPLYFSSELGIIGEQTERLVAICQHFKAGRFYEGTAGKNYIDASQFEKAGIILDYQDYQHPVYKQLYGDFEPYMSVVDLLFNHGDASLDILANPGLHTTEDV